MRKLINVIFSVVCGLATAQINAVVADTSLPDEVTIDGEVFVLIPEGWSYKSVAQFDHKRKEYPLVRVWIDSFYMAKFEAKADDFARFMNAVKADETVFSKPLHESCVVKENEVGEFFVKRPEPNIPASGMSWELAKAFSEWKGFRLPTEAEWEKAARGPEDKRVWPWGNEQPTEEQAVFGFNNFGNHGCDMVQPVDAKPKGVSPYGIYNMSGNVREFVADGSDTQPRGNFQAWLKDGMRNPIGSQDKPHRIMKGGRWGDSPKYITISQRVVVPPEETFRCNSVRFAVDVATVKKMLVEAQQ